jgi:hypothetical protein
MAGMKINQRMGVESPRNLPLKPDGPGVATAFFDMRKLTMLLRGAFSTAC